MPSFTHRNGRYFISYITGPSHVLLGLSLSPTQTHPVMIRESRAGRCNHGTLDEARIQEAVVAGVAEAGAELHPAEIVYCEDDSPRYELFRWCACSLTRRVASGGDFADQKE